MEHQIRLAKEQGLLTGRQLCSAQVAAISYCMTRDDVEQGKRKVTEVRHALAAAHPDPIIPMSQLFPEIFQLMDDTEDINDDEGEVTYIFPDDPGVDESTIEAEIAALLAGPQTMNGGELFGGP